MPTAMVASSRARRRGISRRSSLDDPMESCVYFRDGALSGAEVTRGPLAFVRPPDLTYRDPITILLGGKRVEVLPRPTAHADDNTIVRFVDGTGVLFASDWIMLGKKADVITNIRYREELRAAVAKSIAAGQTLEQAQASVTMDAYKDWEFYAQQRPGNVAGTYRALTSGR